MGKETVSVNRAPVLTLWGAVVAERLGYDWPAALSLGRALAGLNAQSKGRSLGIFGPPKAAEAGAPKKHGLGEEFWIEICGRPLPARNTEDGVRAVKGSDLIQPEKAETYLRSKFGNDLDRVRAAMTELAAAYDPEELREAAYPLYEEFRPKIDSGRRGWGQKGDLDIDLIRSLAAKAEG